VSLDHRGHWDQLDILDQSDLLDRPDQRDHADHQDQLGQRQPLLDHLGQLDHAVLLDQLAIMVLLGLRAGLAQRAEPDQPVRLQQSPDLQVTQGQLAGPEFLDQRDKPDKSAFKDQLDQLDLRAGQDHRVFRVIPEPLVQLDLSDQRDQQDILDYREHRERKEQPEQLVPPDGPARPEQRACADQPELMD
jgi:hypothetical protein